MFGSKNIDMFLENPEYSAPKQPPPFVNRPDTNGGLRLPPVRPRARNPANPIEARVSYMTKVEAEEAKAGIFTQLDEFEEYGGVLCRTPNPALMFLLLGTRHLLYSASASCVSDRRNITRQLGNTSGLSRRRFL